MTDTGIEPAAAGADPGHPEWSLRPWLTGGVLAACALIIWLLTEGEDQSPAIMAAAAFFLFGGLSLAFTIERAAWKSAAIFSAAAGLVMAGLAFHATDAGDHVADEQFGFAAGVFALLLALPLFQAGFHRLRMKTPYRDTHFHVWTDAVSGAGALAFTGLSWIVIAILGELFRLLKIDFIHELLDEGWFGAPFTGAAFGAALGTLRNQIRIIGTLRHVVMLVLSLLAVPTALALAVFLIAMVVSGPDVLWEATRSATPVLLACGAGAFVLTNAIVRDDDGAMSRNPAMRIAALVLAVVILPLTVFAAVSMGTRIAQHGLSPERLWGLLAIAVACAYGLAAFVAVLRGGIKGWPAKLRAANFNLAVGVCAFALVVALPLVDFGAISTRDQIGRLGDGEIAADKFDYHALRWDFGDAGRAALADLAKRGGVIGDKAKAALAETERYRFEEREDAARRVVRYDISDPALRARAERYLQANPYQCGDPCVVLDGGKGAGGKPRLVLVSPSGVNHLTFADDQNPDYAAVPPLAATPAFKPDAKVEIRAYKGRQVYVDGKPVGDPFD